MYFGISIGIHCIVFCYHLKQSNFLFVAKEKLEIVIGTAEPRFAGGLPRRLRRRNAFELR
jgi:hypothetical protein